MKLRIKELRKARGLTQRELADMAGLSQSYLTELENEKKTINVNRMSAIARALGVAPKDLIVGEEKSPHAKLIALFEPLSADQQEVVLRLMETIVSRPGRS